MAQTTKRTNDLYCRDMPSAKAIEEIKHLARVKKVKVATIVHREHSLANGVRSLLGDPAWRQDPNSIPDGLAVLRDLATRLRID